jgi:hypothetical protein
MLAYTQIHQQHCHEAIDAMVPSMAQIVCLMHSTHMAA